MKADIREAERGPAKLPQANASLKCRNSTNHAPATKTIKAVPRKRGGLFVLAIEVRLGSAKQVRFEADAAGYDETLYS